MKFKVGDEVVMTSASGKPEEGVVQMADPCEDGGYMYLVWFDCNRNEWVSESEIKLSEKQRKKTEFVRSLRRI
jgi:hypothetical protein